jgi:NAD(P)-dependent dehydrogenase (short-subunit alcohol dehydrogenase family)
MTKFICITGVSTGIGRALLDFFHQKGYHIIGSVRNHDAVTDLQSNYTERLTVLCFDVRNQEATQIAFADIKNLLSQGHLELLINNAGIAMPGPLECLTEEQFEEQLDINLKSVRRITNLLLPYLKSGNPGRIINISSVSGILNTPFMGAYCISKHALESMTEIYRRELRMFGIKVISILPGPIKTEIWKKNIGKLNPFFETEYGHLLKNADKLIEKSDAQGLPAERVCMAVWKAFTARNPKTGYIVHKSPNVIRFISKVLPSLWLDVLMAKTMSKGDKIRPI